MKGSAIGGVFGEYRGPAHQGFVHAITVIGHAHASLVQVCLLLQEGTWGFKARVFRVSMRTVRCEK